MPPKDTGEEFLKPRRVTTKSMSVDMPMAVLNQSRLITTVMKKNF